LKDTITYMIFGYKMKGIKGFQKGQEGYWKNKKLSEEHKKKISLHSAKYWFGKHLSKEHKKHLSDRHWSKTKIIEPPMKGKHHTRESKKKISEKIRKLYRKGKLNGFKKGNENISKIPEIRKKISKKLKGKHNSIKTEFKKGEKRHLGYSHSEDTKNKLHLKHQLLWKNEKYREKVLKSQRIGMKIRPNIPEQRLLIIIQQNNLPFNYVGNGQIWFKGETHSFNPDFLSKNPKYIIEVFGDYWHNRKEIKERDIERLQTYTKYGYKTLIIWQHEIVLTKFGKQLEEKKLINKIKKFIK